MAAAPYEPLTPFAERAVTVGRTLERSPSALAIYWKVIAGVDPKEVAMLQEKYRERLIDFDPAAEPKYGDICFWVAARAQRAVDMGMDRARPTDILDIGMGCGFWAAVCNAAGHACVGMDVANEFYADICRILRVERHYGRVYRQKPFIGLGRKFGMITIMAQVFDVILDETRKRIGYWSIDDWRFFIDDLARHHLTEPGELYMEMNRQVIDDGSTAVDEALLSFFRERAGHVDVARVRVHWPLVTRNTFCE